MKIFYRTFVAAIILFAVSCSFDAPKEKVSDVDNSTSKPIAKTKKPSLINSETKNTISKDATPCIDVKPVERALPKASKYFHRVISTMSSIDFYLSKPKKITQLDNYRDNVFTDINECVHLRIQGIRAAHLKKKSTWLYGTTKYHPDVFIEEWHFVSHKEAIDALGVLDKLHRDFPIKMSFVRKGPSTWFVVGNRIYVVNMRATAFARWLPKIIKTMKNVAKREKEKYVASGLER